MRVLPGLSFLCLVLPSAVGGEAQAPAPPAPGSQSGAPTASPATAAPTAALNVTPATQTYHNDTLHVTYSYPAVYTDASAVVGAAFQASLGEMPLGGKDATHCITLPFSVMSTAGGQLSIVLLVRADAGCLKRTFTAEQLPEFTQGEVQGLSASGAKPQFGEPVSFTVAGHPAQQLKGSFALPTGESMHAMVTCVLLKPDVACWQFLGSSDESLRTMSGFPVVFDGGTAASFLAPPAHAGKP